MDSHLDTIVSCSNFTVVHYIDRVCDVSSYYDEYEQVKGVPVVHAATSYTTNTGDNFILTHNKVVWMHNQGHRLINKNHICHNVVEVQDNPFSKYTMFTQSNADNFTACLESTGNNTRLTRWTPTTDDMKKLPHVLLSPSNPCDPHKIQFPYISYYDREEIE